MEFHCKYKTLQIQDCSIKGSKGHKESESETEKIQPIRNCSERRKGSTYVLMYCPGQGGVGSLV